MTELGSSTETLNQNLDTGSSVSNSAPSPEIKQEKMIEQSKINEIVSRAKEEARERGRREALEELQRQQSANTNAQTQSQHSSMGGMQNLSQDEIRRLVAEETQKFSQQQQHETQQKLVQQQIQETVNSFAEKILANKDKYPDLEQKLVDLGIDKFPKLFHLTNSTENTVDIWNELADNPLKADQLERLAERSPHVAIREMKKLSDSIKQNQAAMNQRKVNEPLSQIRPSTTSTDNGSLTISDLKKTDWLRA